MAVPGFMDRQIPVGTSWPDHLADALSNCRVFVALFSPAYFTSEYCGKEWAAFRERAKQHLAGTDKYAIIPAMWVPMDTDEMPPALHSIQNVQQQGFPPAYVAEGLYGIMKLGRYRDRYKETVLRLANLIKDRAAECALPPGPVADLDSLRNPFAESPSAAKRHPVRLTLAAQSIDELPPDRDSYYYGRTAREWTPYRSHDNTTPIGAYAEQIITELGHNPTVDSIDEPPGDPGESPAVLVVDPWATRDPAIRDRLKQIEDNPANVVAPFNTEDRQTASSAAELATDLTETLPKSIALNGSAKHVPTLDAFRDALPKAVNEAIKRFFKTTETYPPQTPPTMQRPRLNGPDF